MKFVPNVQMLDDSHNHQCDMCEPPEDLDSKGDPRVRYFVLHHNPNQSRGLFRLCPMHRIGVAVALLDSLSIGGHPVIPPRVNAFVSYLVQYGLDVLITSVVKNDVMYSIACNVGAEMATANTLRRFADQYGVRVDAYTNDEGRVYGYFIDKELDRGKA